VRIRVHQWQKDESANSLGLQAGMTLGGSFLVFDPHFMPYVELTLFSN